MAEILSSLTLTQLGLLLALVFFLTILVLVALLWYLRRARLARETELGEQALAAEAAGSRLVLNQAPGTGQLSVEIDGREYASLDQVADAGARRRIVRAAIGLARFSGVVKPAMPDGQPDNEWREELRTGAPKPAEAEERPDATEAAATEVAPAPDAIGVVPAPEAAEKVPAVEALGVALAPEAPAVSEEGPLPGDLPLSTFSPDTAQPPFPEPALSEAELAVDAPAEPPSGPNGRITGAPSGESAEDAFMAQLREAEMAPPPPRKTLALLVPRPVRPERDQPFVVQIEKILQRRAKAVGLDQPVHIRVDSSGVLRVEWAGTLYDSPGDVPDPAIRELIRESVGEWESSGS